MEDELVKDLNDFLEHTETDATMDYLLILQDTNKCIKKLTEDIDELSARLDEERRARKVLESQLLDYKQTAHSNINKYLFNFYVKSCRDRPAKLEEWILFIKTFRFSEEKKLNNEIYEWIDRNVN